MVLSFESSTLVYRFQSEGLPVLLSDSITCQFATTRATLYACSMFEGQGIVQVLSISIAVLMSRALAVLRLPGG
jgi:hypothetical protein